MSSDDPPSVGHLPALRWLNEMRGNAVVDAEGVLIMSASAKTDWFNPAPVAGQPQGLANAPALVFEAVHIFCK